MGPFHGELLLADFEGAAEASPRAAMSLQAAGDLRHPHPLGNPARDAFLSALGLREKDLAAPRLYHSRRVLSAERADEWSPERLGDGVVSGPGGLIPAITVADCMPIWILDLRTGAMAALHSGWQGTGIVIDGLSAMGRAWGTLPEDCSAILGPHIRPCCYKVSPERAVQFMDHWGEAAALDRDGSWRLDLAAVNEGLLRSAGLNRIRRIDACTACLDGFGSFRRQGREGFTRMLAFFLPPKNLPPLDFFPFHGYIEAALEKERVPVMERSPVAQSVEQVAVNHWVWCSSHHGGAKRSP